jgi:hypothetical protein
MMLTTISDSCLLLPSTFALGYFNSVIYMLENIEDSREKVITVREM